MRSGVLHPLDKYIIAPGIEPLPSMPLDSSYACLYNTEHCSGLPSTSEEHIFNSAWGGVVQTPWLICSNCNSKFSSTLDTSFEDYVVRIKNARGMPTQRRKKAPSVTIVGGKYREYAQLVSYDANEKTHEYFEFEPPLQYRSVAHTCLKVLGHFQPDLARLGIFDDIKRFIYKGTHYERFAIATDEENYFLPDRAQFFMGSFNHVILYFSKRLNKVIGVFRMLGVVKRSIVLSHEWNPEDIRSNECVLIFSENTFHPKVDYTGYDPSGRVRRYVLDRDTPVILRILPDNLDEPYFRNEILNFEKWRFALAPSYKIRDYLTELENSNTLLTKPVLQKLEEEVVVFIATLLPRYTSQDLPTTDVQSILAELGFYKLLSDYEDKTLDDYFNRELKGLWQSAAKRIMPDVTFLV